MYGLLRFVIVIALAVMLFKQQKLENRNIIIFLTALLIVLSLLPPTRMSFVIDGFTAPIGSPNTDPVVDPLFGTGPVGVFGVPAYGF